MRLVEAARAGASKYGWSPFLTSEMNEDESIARDVRSALVAEFGEPHIDTVPRVDLEWEGVWCL